MGLTALNNSWQRYRRVAIGALLCALGAAAILTSQWRADASRQEAYGAVKLSACVDGITAFEADSFGLALRNKNLSVIAAQKLDQLSLDVSVLKGSGEIGHRMAEIRRKADKYSASLLRETDFLAAGKETEARFVDLHQVDPVEEGLKGDIESLRLLLEKEASLDDFFANLVTILGMIAITFIAIRTSVLQQKMLENERLDRTLAEAAKLNEGRLRAILNRSASLLLITNEQGIIARASGGLGAGLESFPELAQGADMAAYVSSSSQEALRAALATLRNGLAVPTFELDLQVGRTLIRAECAAVDYRSETRIDGFLWTITDISKRARALREVSETHERLNEILTRMNVMAFSVAADGSRTLYISPGCSEIFGGPSEDFLNDPNTWLRAIHPDDFEAAIAAVTEVATKGEVYCEFRILRPDGDVRWVSDWVRTVKNPTGEIIRLDGFLRDCTAEKIAALALDESERRYQRVASNVPGVVFQLVLDVSGDYCFPYVSSSVDSVFGISDLAIMHTPDRFFESIEGEDRATFYQALETSERTQTTFHWEGRLSRTLPGAEDTWIQISAQPERRIDSSVVWDGIVLDITERKRAADFERERATQDQANREKSKFLSRMSHELRTPLNAILGFGQLLQMKARSEEDMEMVGHLVKGGKHLLSLVNDVLDISRIDSGSGTLSLEPVNLDSLLAEVVGLMSPIAMQSEIKIECHRHEDKSLFVEADVQRLRQVILNLVSNGIKYNKPGGSLTVASVLTEDNGVRIEVTDTGIGVPSQLRDRLFTAFDRLGAEQGNIEGTGLGLALARRLVETMGGHLWMEEAQHGGSTFICELNRSNAPALGDIKSVVLPLPESFTKMVLHIEDNFASGRLVETVARYAGVKLQTCGQGRLGIEQAKALLPDLILLDLDLPDLGGLDVLSQLKSDPSTAGIPVVIVSADASPDRQQTALSLGAAGYLTKPFNISVMFDTIRRDFRIESSAA